MTSSSQIADYALTALLDNPPESVTQTALQAMIDQYGLQIAGSEFSWSQSIYRCVMAYNGAGKSTVTRYGNPLVAPQAAFINSCFAHAQDFDDSHQAAQTHPGSVVIPAAMAVGEQRQLSGEMVLKAIIIGMEIMLRLAHSLCPSCIEGGHHTPPTIGPFGAAVACGLLLGLTHAQLTHALGICGSYSGGLVEYTLSGGSVKRMHTGLGARAGLEAALLAQEGLTGPRTIIEGDKGVWAVYGRGNAVAERLLEGLGKHYLLSTLLFKPYNCCYLIHPAIQAFLTLCHEHTLIANDIEQVTVGMSQFSCSHAGRIRIPSDALGAQFSTCFTLSLTLIKGAPDMWSYTDDVLVDPGIIALAQKISVYKDSVAHQAFPQQNGCLVTITTTAKKILSLRVKDPKGSPHHPLSPHEIQQKFFNNVSPVLGDNQAAAAYTTLSNFNRLDNVRDLAACVTKRTAAISQL